MTEQNDQKFPLPPCRVCCAPGAGFHYGVNTCEACKGFFHRSLTYAVRYTCVDKGNCVIQYGKGKMCRWCRYQKCLNMGMSKSAIKTGRYNYNKKTKDILEVKQMKVTISDDGEIDNSSLTIITNTPQACVDSHTSFQDTTGKALSISDDQSKALSDPRLDKSKNILREDEEHIMSPSSMENLTPEQRLFNDVTASVLHEPYWSQNLSFDFRNDISFTSSPCSTTSSLNSPLSSAGDSHSSSPANKGQVDNNRPIQAPSQHNFSGLEYTEETRSSSSVLSCEMLMPPPCSDNVVDAENKSETESNKNDEIQRLFQDSEYIIKLLVDAHGRYVAPAFPNIPDDEIAEQQKEHYEAFKLRTEMFGRYIKLEDHEYEDIYSKTGIDADGRKCKMIEYAKGMEKVIQGMVFFAKIIPGFSMLTTDEKINLIKYSRQEICFLNLYKYVNLDMKVYRSVENHWHVVQDGEHSELRRQLDNIFQFLSKFQLMNLTHTECVILQALAIMAPDRGNPVTTSTIPAIYDKLVDLLLYELKKQHERPMLHFAKIMSLITECRTKEEDLTATFKKQNYIRHIPFNDKPFLHEMFTGIYLDFPCSTKHLLQLIF